MIKCIWCGKTYPYNWDTDEIDGVDSETLDCRVGNLIVYYCSCGGSLAISTLENRGGSLLTHEVDN